MKAHMGSETWSSLGQGGSIISVGLTRDVIVNLVTDFVILITLDSNTTC